MVEPQKDKERDNSDIEAAKTVGDNDIPFVTLQDGRKVEIYKCKVKHLGTILQLIAEILDKLGINDFKNAEKGTAQIQDPTFIVALITEYLDKFAYVVSLLTSINDEDFGELDLDDAVSVVMKAYEVNESFLSSKVLPMVRERVVSGRR